jgi:hypothetical protein
LYNSGTGDLHHNYPLICGPVFRRMQDQAGLFFVREIFLPEIFALEKFQDRIFPALKFFAPGFFA